MPKYVMVIDVERCIGCMACVIACKKKKIMLQMDTLEQGLLKR